MPNIWTTTHQLHGKEGPSFVGNISPTHIIVWNQSQFHFGCILGHWNLHRRLPTRARRIQPIVGPRMEAATLPPDVTTLPHQRPGVHRECH